MNGVDEDFYSLLGVDPKDDLTTIRSAYRKLARELHPDVSDQENAHERFNRLTEAYQVLSDEKKRRQYDTMRALSFGLPFEKIRQKATDPATLRNLMKKVATGLAAAAGLFRGSTAKPGRNLRVTADITFFQSYLGADVEVEYGRPIVCSECRGTGFSQIEPCLTCAGEGRLKSEGFPGIRKRCPRCDGLGWRGVDPCQACQQTGRITRNRKVKLFIPPGVNHQQRLRVRGMGEEGRGFGGEGKAGDLIVVVNVTPHPVLTREGNDFHAEIEVPFHTAVVGGGVEMELPQGRLTIEIPPLTWNGRLLRLIGAGFPDAKIGGRGDAFFKARIATPENDREREIFSRYGEQVRGPGRLPDDSLKADLERVFAS